ncbi:unnamed protein product [Acanthoscelides obtectus]|uniref:Uncharacterized protein n=1 Tax=Acanthoscelides obtectus TaxID=200917 RepID=A0A9P0LII4_ACAOB|nr:unnamed protein product [Acanthoscelides obtectus]CAK1632994.1 hypothetical protein AOBTE_LOCUS7861 [Acanthoscelides obtectus]
MDKVLGNKAYGGLPPQTLSPFIKETRTLEDIDSAEENISGSIQKSKQCHIVGMIKWYSRKKSFCKKWKKELDDREVLKEKKIDAINNLADVIRSSSHSV